ncbi:MAG: SPFH domain-containing protein [Pirellulales bacterium]|nr:SPFH domain-containing protein [Pirellulales bacterium]
MIVERTYQSLPGWLFLVVVLVLLALATALFYGAAVSDDPPGRRVFTGIVLVISALVISGGFQAVAPNEARVLLLFGKYQGTIKQDGFWWVNPFFTKRKLSLRVRNFETGQQVTPEVKSPEGKLVQAAKVTRRPTKVNDRDGNPVEISAVVVWRVVNTAEATFEVDDYEDFVHLQSESALRTLASRYPYDSIDDELSLRRSTAEVSDQIKLEIDARLHKAGVEVLEARINHLAYAPEIAAAMLQRQQAQAVVAARTKIVEGAVTMVEMALDHLAEKKLVELKGDRRAEMVSNLLVVLCGDRHAQPVINLGGHSHE